MSSNYPIPHQCDPEKGCGVPASINHDQDNINHPQHYNSHPSGIECIQVTEHFNFNVGNALKYLWRAGYKIPDTAMTVADIEKVRLQDLRKAAWYVNREIERLTKS